MANSIPFQAVTIIGFNFLHPIAALVEKLLALPPTSPSGFQVSPLENGYAASTVALVAFMVESSIRRTQYILGSNVRQPIAFLEQSFPDYASIADLRELFVARDVIAHNHLWEAGLEWGPSGDLRLLQTSKIAGGDSKYDAVVDLSTITTRHLHLNVYPTRVGRKDVSTALSSARSFFEHLEAKDRRYFYISPQVFQFRAQLLTFGALVDLVAHEVGAA